MQPPAPPILALLLLLIASFLVPGFSQCQCPRLDAFEEDDLTGTFKSPQYPSRYCARLSCNYVINPDSTGQSAIRVHFENFKTEERHDFLEVSIQENGQQYAVKRLTGEGAHDIVTAPGDGLHFRFRTDGSVSYQGFVARFTRFNESEERCVCDRLVHRVGSTPGALTSPNYPKPYCGNLHCFHILQSDTTKSVEMTVDRLDLEPGQDWLILYEGESNYTSWNRNNRITSLTGTLPSGPQTNTTRGHTLIVEFVTDWDAHRSGFHATYREVPSICSCPQGELTSVRGTFSSPGFPLQYCDNINCIYSFRVPTGNVIKLSFLTFELENTADWLTAYDPSQPEETTLAAWTGVLNHPFNFTSNGPVLALRFKTDTTNIMDGFNGVFRAVPRPSNCHCPSPMPYTVSGTTRPSGTTGTLSSPGYPNPYCGPLDCLYYLPNPAPNHRIIITADVVSTRGPVDFVQIFTGKLHANRRPNLRDRRRLAGEERNLSISYQADDGVTVHFHTEAQAQNSEKGFRLSYLWKQRCVCPSSGSLTAGVTSGNISSPDHPLEYCSNLSCKWTITAPFGQRVRIRIIGFRTEQGEDFMRIYNGDSTRSRLLRQLSGYLHGSRTFFSSGRSLTVAFTTDRSVTYSGFLLSYQSTGGGIATPSTSTQSDIFSTRTTTQTTTTEKSEETQKSTGLSSGWTVAGPILLVFLLAVVGALVYFFVLRDKAKIWWLRARSEQPTVGYVNENSNARFGGNYRSRIDSSQMSLVTDHE